MKGEIIIDKEFITGKNKSSIRSLLLFLVLTTSIILLFFVFEVTGFTASAGEQDEDIQGELLDSGKMIYIFDGKQLGNETYRLIRKETEDILLVSEGIVTIPIPFIRPKIKYDQRIEVDNDYRPLSFFLQYRGPLGIGNKKVTAKVTEDEIDIKDGKEEKSVNLDGDNYVFSGTSGSQAMFSYVLSRRENISSFSEIRLGNSGPPSEDEDRVVRDLILNSTDRTEMMIEGKNTPVTSYVFTLENGDQRRELITENGNFILYSVEDEDNSFYVYREDKLGKDFKLEE